MEPKEIAKLINVLNNVYLTNIGKSDVANIALDEMKHLIKFIPTLMDKTTSKEK